MKKRLLALLLCLVMVLSLVPVALAGDGTSADSDTSTDNHITVCLSKNDGTSAYTTQQSVSVSNGSGGTAEVVGSVTAPTRAGYTFDGWYVISSCTGDAWDLQNYAITGDSSNCFWLFAKWILNTYTIKFDDNGGTGTMADITTEGAEGISLPASAFKYTGYTQDGWTIDGQTVRVYAALAYVTVDTLAILDEDNDKTVTLKPNWVENETESEAKHHTITYIDPVSGKAAFTSTTKTVGSEEKHTIMDLGTLTLPAGKVFANKWKDGTTEYEVGTAYSFTKDTKLYVVYDTTAATPETAKVTYYRYNYGTATQSFNKVAGTTGDPAVSYNTAVYVDPDGGSFKYQKTGDTTATSVDKTVTTIVMDKDVTLKDATKSGYTFTGWSFNSSTNTFTAQWTANHASYCDVYYYDYDDGKYEYAEFAYGTSIVIDPNGGTAKLNGTSFKTSQSFSIYRDYTLTDASRTGYTFYGWVLARSGNTWYFTAMWTRKSTVPYMLNGDDHYAYITGYPGGTFKPTACITRAEAATIFYRLLTDSTRSLYSTSYNTFKDVPANAWYATAVSTMAKLGIVNGSNGYFRPNDYITRAEIAAMVARCDGSYYSSSYSSFSDTVGHWASSYIQRAYELGWINGYGKTYKPDQYINRAETVAILNRVLGRAPQYTTDLVKYMNTFTDVSVTAWYYLDVQEAANSHTYTRKTNGYEYWNKLIADPSWMK